MRYVRHRDEGLSSFYLALLAHVVMAGPNYDGLR